jgi:hypothetical protein
MPSLICRDSIFLPISDILILSLDTNSGNKEDDILIFVSGLGGVYSVFGEISHSFGVFIHSNKDEGFSHMMQV